MALWDKITSRGNVEDRRGISTGALGGGASLLIVGAVLLFNYFGISVDPNAVEQVVQQFNQTTIDPEQQPAEFKGEDSYEVFTATVLGSTNDMWTDLFGKNGQTFSKPKLVLFRDGVTTSCGFASSATGPFYCPGDQTIYLDETFFDELKQRLGGDNGDVAQAYVIAHEAGHHAQHLLGLLDSSQGNEASIRTELQADCFAGLWAYSVQKLGVFENEQEVNEAINAARAVGDDNIQKQAGQSVNPENWTHGSSEQRVSAFQAGYTTGDFARCE